MVVVQLVERSPLTPEICSSNPVTGKLLNIEHLCTVNCVETTKIKKKRPGMAHFLLNFHLKGILKIVLSAAAEAGSPLHYQTKNVFSLQIIFHFRDKINENSFTKTFILK